MNSDAPTPEQRSSSGDENPIGRAAAELSRQADARWVEISDRVLAKALGATRRSHPVRAQASSGPVQISEQVVITHLRDALDGAVPGSALSHVRIDIEGRDVLAGVAIQLIAQYGRPLLPIAAEIRALATTRLIELLGPVAPPVTVELLHVHFSDVTRQDPYSGEPPTGNG